jgi:Domain of unknown function (DUF4386)
MLNSVDHAQRKAARTAGLACLISFPIVLAVNFGIFAPLFVRGNPSQTASNILAHVRLFRAGIAGNLLYSVCALVFLVALYVILRPVDRYLALFAALGRFVHVITWVLASLNLFTAVRLLTDALYLRAFAPNQLPVLARLYLSGFDAYYVGLLFWALGDAVGSYALLKSRYIPRSLAAFGMISSAWCALCTLVFYIFPDFDKVVNLWWFDSPMATFELVMSFWFLLKGLRPSGTIEPERRDVVAGEAALSD